MVKIFSCCKLVTLYPNRSDFAFVLVGFTVIAGAFCYDVVLDKRLDEWMPTKVSIPFRVLILESMLFFGRMIPMLVLSNGTANWGYLKEWIYHLSI